MSKYKDSDKTEWFQTGFKPAYVGYYERKYDSPSLIEAKDFWDGESFWICSDNGEKIGMALCALQWRGLRFDASKEPA